MADSHAERIVIPGYDGPFAGRGAEAAHAEGSFVERIQDMGVRYQLAFYISTNGIYGKLDLGYSFDEALETSLGCAIANKELLDSIVEAGNVSPSVWSEEDWHATLDAMIAGERPSYEPGKVRKWLAKTVLRQEVETKKHVINLVPWRKRASTHSEGMI